MRFIIIILLLNYGACYSQSGYDTLKNTEIYSTFHANTLSVHPFGVFISRINNNFQLKPDRKISISANISSGNVWLPYVKAYNPLNEDDRIAMKKIVWHKRQYEYDLINSPSKTTEFHADGVIRQYQVKFNYPISDKHELKTDIRMFSLDRGNVPASLLTSVKFIEWYHSNIAGGEDLFGRKAYGLDQARIRYKDENGKRLELDNGDFMFSGIDLSYYYYPHFNSFEKHRIYTNVGLQIVFVTA